MLIFLKFYKQKVITLRRLSDTDHFEEDEGDGGDREDGGDGGDREDGGDGGEGEDGEEGGEYITCLAGGIRGN